MPTINIPPKVRFALYLLSALGSVAAAYLFTKGFVGEAETGLWAGVVAIINAIAASKTDIDPATYNPTGGNRRILGKSVMSPLDPRPNEKGQGAVHVLLIILLVLAVIALIPAALSVLR